MIAKNSNAAVGAKLWISSMIAPATPPSGTTAAPSCTAATANTAGTRMRAITGVNRLLRIRYMKIAIIPNPRPTSMGRNLRSAITPLAGAGAGPPEATTRHWVGREHRHRR
jgi:hypothetical protein